MAVDEIHPGEHLREELKELGISAAELARKLNVPTNRLTAILNGQRAITGDTALRLAHFFGTSPEFWLNLQSLYELRIAQKNRQSRQAASQVASRACPCVSAMAISCRMH
jgi:antitoxin HigA-1